MFTAITVTRSFLRLLIGVGFDKHHWLFAVMDEHQEPTASAAAD
jgi:hypothetical protein